MGYDHTQRARWVAGALLIVMFALVAAALLVEMAGWVRVVLILVGLIDYLLFDSFGRLRVRVEAGSVLVAFGRGWPHKVMPLDSIAAVNRSRSKWWYGWGIRRIPSGWLWNVSGFDYIEIFLTDGTVFSVGTDEPDALLAAIRPWIGGRA